MALHTTLSLNPSPTLLALPQVGSLRFHLPPSLPAVHEPLDCEYSILKQRLARRLKAEGQSEDSVKALDLVGLTKVAERTISADLELLISKAVDVNKADYAVVTGVQVCGWQVAEPLLFRFACLPGHQSRCSSPAVSAILLWLASASS